MADNVFTRDYRDIEKFSLADYAVRGADSKGRRFPEPEHSYRNPFQRDRDRIIHSSAFRRLEAKTQVFTVSRGDYYRNRLTHTIEVSQISRTIARALHLNEDLSEAIALAHDLGHPPFGHVGEGILHEIMKNEGGFEHNRQGLRVVDSIETRYPDFPGLNLTYEVREGIIKHRTEYDSPEISADLAMHGAPTLEAQLVNLADEITYSCHDMDDGLKSGLLTEDGVARAALVASAMEQAAHPKLDGSGKMRRYQLVRRLINMQVSDVLSHTQESLEKISPKSLNDVRERCEGVVSFSPEMKVKAAELKKYLFENFYRHPQVAGSALAARKIITGLFEAFDNEFSLIPQDIRERAAGEPQRRIICDYIAGMTDRFAMNEHERIYGG